MVSPFAQMRAWRDLIKDAIDQFELVQAIPSPPPESAVDDLRFVRKDIDKVLKRAREAREEFERAHPLAEEYDPDDGFERE